MEMTKTQTRVDAKIDELLNTAAVLEMFKGWIEPKDYFSVRDSEITLWPNSEEDSRRYVGSLMRVFKGKPTTTKSGTSLIAVFRYNGVTVTIHGYKTKKCAILKKTIVHEAEPEKIIPAKASWVEEVEELVCEMPKVETEIDVLAPVVAAEPVKEEVPF